MNNKASGGDKIITFLRRAGDVCEDVTKGLLTCVAFAGMATIVFRLGTDLRVNNNKKKMKKGGSYE